MNALTDADRAAMQRKVCRMIEWVSQLPSIGVGVGERS